MRPSTPGSGISRSSLRAGVCARETAQPSAAAIISNKLREGISIFLAVRYSLRNASDCNWVISNGLRQRMLAQDSLSSRLTMYDCAFAKRARSRSSAPRGSCARLRRTTQVTLYSAAWPHLGQIRVCARCSVVSLKNSRSSIAGQLVYEPALPFRLNLFHTRPCRDETQADSVFCHQGGKGQCSRTGWPTQTCARAVD